jgi:prevent-host-death family protein
MKVVTITCARRHFGALLDEAQKGPVMIRRRNRDIAVMMSVRGYLRITGITKREFDEEVRLSEVRGRHL